MKMEKGAETQPVAAVKLIYFSSYAPAPQHHHYSLYWILLGVHPDDAMTRTVRERVVSGENVNNWTKRDNAGGIFIKLKKEEATATKYT